MNLHSSADWLQYRANDWGLGNTARQKTKCQLLKNKCEKVEASLLQYNKQQKIRIMLLLIPVQANGQEEQQYRTTMGKASCIRLRKSRRGEAKLSLGKQLRGQWNVGAAQ